MTAQLSAELTGSNFTLSVLKLTTLDLDAVRALLVEKQTQAPCFFQHAPVVVNLEKLPQLPDLQCLKQMMQEHLFLLVGLTGLRETHLRQQVQQQGFPILSTFNRNIELHRPQSQEPTLHTTRVHKGHVRSGQQIYAENASLVILGMVGLGAEVIADDSLHVYGALRGRAIAGIKNKKAGIFCARLEPELLSIAGVYQLSDALPKQHWRQNTHVYLHNDQLTFHSIT